MRRPNVQERPGNVANTSGCANWFAKGRAKGDKYRGEAEGERSQKLKWTLAGDLPRTGRNAEAVEAIGSAGTLRS
jgi:hypothetical protein